MLARKLYQAELPPDQNSYDNKIEFMCFVLVASVYLAFLYARTQSAPQIMRKADVVRNSSINIQTALETICSNISTQHNQR